MLESKMILAISICEAGGYVVTQSSCPSASATDANVGDDPPLVLIHPPFRLGLISAFSSFEVSGSWDHTISYVAPGKVLYTCLLGG